MWSAGKRERMGPWGRDGTCGGGAATWREGQQLTWREVLPPTALPNEDGSCLLPSSCNILSPPPCGTLVITVTSPGPNPPQVLGVDSPLACASLLAAIEGLPGAVHEAVSPLEAVRRMLSQPVFVQASTAEELHAKV